MFVKEYIFSTQWVKYDVSYKWATFRLICVCFKWFFLVCRSFILQVVTNPAKNTPLWRTLMSYGKRGLRLCDRSSGRETTLEIFPRDISRGKNVWHSITAQIIKASLLNLIWDVETVSQKADTRVCAAASWALNSSVSAHPNTRANLKPAPVSVWSVVTRGLPLSILINITGFTWLTFTAV